MKWTPTNKEFKASLGWAGTLLVVFLLNAWVLITWISTDTRPLAWDQAIHTEVAQDYQARIEKEGFFSILKPAYYNYPPLYHLTLSWVLDIPDDVANAGAIINIIYLGFLLLGLFLLGRVYLDPWPAVIAAFVLTCYPVFIEAFKYPLVDLPLTAWLTWAILALIKSDHFSKKGWSIIFGITFALGMLTKWTAFVYVSGPLAWSTFYVIKTKRWKMWALSLGIFFLIIFPWYAINIIPMVDRLIRVSTMDPAGHIEIPKWLGWTWYGMALFRQMGLVLTLLFIPGLVAVYWKPKLFPLFLWFITSLVLFSFLHNKNIRYTMPVLPAVAILSLAWIPPFRKGTVVGIGVGTFIIFVLTHMVPIKTWAFYVGPFQIPVIEKVPPLKEDWKHKEIIQKITEVKGMAGPISRVLTVTNAPVFHSTTLNATRRSMKVDNFAFRGPSESRWFEFAEFILYKTGYIGPEFTQGNVGKCAQVLATPPAWFKDVYKRVESWPMPDGSQAILLKADPTPQNISNAGFFNFEMDEMRLPRIVATHVKVRAVPISSEQTDVGHLKELRLEADKLVYKKFEFNDVEVRLIDLHVNLPLLLETQEIQLLKLGRLKPQATLDSEALLGYAARKAKWLKDPQIEFIGSTVRIKGKAYGVPVELEADIIVDNQILKTRIKKLSILKIPFPLIFVRGFTNREVPLIPYRETPFYLDIKGINGMGQTVRLESL
jgi:hypothetical protein